MKNNPADYDKCLDTNQTERHDCMSKKDATKLSTAGKSSRGNALNASDHAKDILTPRKNLNLDRITPSEWNLMMDIFRGRKDADKYKPELISIMQFMLPKEIPDNMEHDDDWIYFR